MIGFCHCVTLLSPRISGGVVVMLLACGARGPMFDSWSRHYDFKDWLSSDSSRDMAGISLKRRISSKHPPPPSNACTDTVSQTMTDCW